MPPNEILAIRHGEFIGNEYVDPPLSEFGINEIKRAANVIFDHCEKFQLTARIVCSPSARTIQTAQIIASVFPDLNPEIINDLSDSTQDKIVKESIQQLIRETDHSLLVVVTHARHVPYIPEYANRQIRFMDTESLYDYMSNVPFGSGFLSPATGRSLPTEPTKVVLFFDASNPQLP